MKRLNITFILIFIVVNVFICISVAKIREAYDYANRSKIVSSNSNLLTKIKRETDEVFSIQKDLNEFYALLSEEDNDLISLEKKCNSFYNSGFGFVKFKFFDSSDKPISLNNIGNNDSLNGAMQRLYIALNSYKSNNDDSLLKRYKSLFESLLGAVDLKKLAEETSTLIPITLSGKAGYIYWNTFENNNKSYLKGFLAWIRKSDIPPRFLFQKVIDKYNSDKYEVKTQLGFIDVENKYFYCSKNISSDKVDSDYAFQGENQLIQELIMKIQELKASLKSYGNIDNSIFSYVEVANNCYFYCLSKDYNSVISKIISEFFIIDLVLLAICFVVIFIKLSATSLILIGKMLPISVFWGIAFLVFLFFVNFFTDETLINYKKAYVYDNLKSEINWLDEGYELAKNDLAEKLIEFSKNKPFINFEVSSVEQLVFLSSNKFFIDKLYITDTSGNPLYTYPRKSDDIFNKIIPVIGRKIALDRLGTAENWKERLDGLMINSFSKSFSELIGEDALKILKAFENYDKVSEIKLGNNKQLVFSTIVETQNKKPLILIVWLNSKNFCQNYLINKIKDSNALPENIKNTNLAMIPIKLDSQPYPNNITKYPFSREITNRVIEEKELVEFEGVIGSKKTYGIGKILQNIPDYVIFALQDD